MRTDVKVESFLLLSSVVRYFVSDPWLVLLDSGEKGNMPNRIWPSSLSRHFFLNWEKSVKKVAKSCA